MHEGTDMAGAYGTPIYATADGTVTFAGWHAGYGRHIKITHANGIHDHLLAPVTDPCRRGPKGLARDRIGDMGNSGRSTGTHLHYEVRINGTP